MYTTLDHYIDGKWVKPSGKTLEVYNPANSKVIGELGAASADVTQAWSKMKDDEKKTFFVKMLK